MNEKGHAARLLLALLATLTTSWLLIQLGEGYLGVPLADLEALETWAEASTAPVLAMSVLRLVALGLCGYLAVALLVSMLAMAVHRVVDARQAARRLLPTFLRQLLLGGAGVGLAGTTLPWAGPAAAVGAAPVVGDEDVAVMVKLGPDESLTTQPPAAPSTTTTTATTTPTTTISDEELPEGPAATSPGEQSGQADEQTWVVAPGDSFWSIAEEMLAERAAANGDEPPTERMIGKYWAELVTLNVAVLAQPDDPDLLFSGQQLRLPPI